MATIKSEVGIAQGHADSLKSSATSLESVSGAEKDGQSTVQGNGKASEVIDQSKHVTGQIMSAISNASAHLSSIATTFDKADQDSAEQFGG